MNSQKVKEAIKTNFNYMKDQYLLNKEYIPKSIAYTKIELPIHYSNLVYIEDMHIENSTYFISSNGFVSKEIKLSSPKHDKNFHMHNCIFRIYPKTFNVNKDKVIEYIDNQSASITDNIKEIHFKFCAEMFNNIDIIQNKFGEPVRYGDIIMLLHEHSRLFVEFIPSSKTIKLSHNDSEATLFSVEPAKDIMLNDDQILKTGQPIKLKIAWFSYANKNLYFGLRFPYQNKNTVLFNNSPNKDNTKQIEEPNKHKEDRDQEDIHIIKESDNEDISQSISIEDGSIVKYEDSIYDEKTNQYYQRPEIIIEENTPMKWRFSLYSTFTTNENLIIYGDLVQIFHCFNSSVLSIDIANSKVFDQQSIEYKLLNLQHCQNDDSSLNNTNNFHQSHSNIDLNDSLDNDNDNIINVFDQSVSQIDDEEDFSNYNLSSSSSFELINQSMFTNNQELDVNSTWMLVNLFPSKRNHSFIRYYEQYKLDTYHMVFRLQNFRTNQILTIQQCRSISDDNLTGTKLGRKLEGYIEGEEENSGKMYKFVLINDNPQNNRSASDSDILTEEYQYSLFGFKKSLKGSSYYSSMPEKNDFLYIYHIVSKSYLCVIPKSDNDKKCVLSLVKNPDEREIFKILPIDSKLQWEYRFLNNLMNLINYVISNILKLKETKSIIATKAIVTKMLTITKFVLDNLVKYLTNMFIDKFVSDSGYNSVVKSRQILISNFGFTCVFLRHLIYNYWINNNMEELKKLNEVLILQQNKRHVSNAFNHVNDITFSMFTYTKGIFDFLILYCKDNEEIKDELYMNLEICFYFINLIDSCLDCMIEIFKNNETKLISLIRDCNQNEKFKSTLFTIGSLYFPKAERAANYNLIDLIFDFIAISKYEHELKGNANGSTGNSHHTHGNQGRYAGSSCKDQVKGISLLTREKYFKLLKALVYSHNTNILENQREIINKIITKKKDNSDAYVFKDFIYNKPTNSNCNGNKGLIEKDTSSELPPSLKELLFSIADQNPDDKINVFIQSQEQFTINKLFPNDKRKIDDDVLAANIKWIIYFFPSSEYSSSIIDPDEIKKRQIFAQKIKAFYYDVISQLGAMESSIDFTNRSQVNLINSFLLLLKMIFAKNSFIDVTYTSYNNISGILLSYLTRKFQVIQANDTQNLSHLIHGEMNEKKLILKQRITKSDHSQYSSIAEGWLNAYLVFKFYLLKSLEETTKPQYNTQSANIHHYNLINGKMISRINLDSNNSFGDYGNAAINSENKDLLTHHKDKDNTDHDLIMIGSDISNNNQLQPDKTRFGAKNEMTFYTKDELIESETNNNKKLLSRTRSFLDDSSKARRTSSPDLFHSKTKSIFHELNTKPNGNRDASDDEKQKNIDAISINIINILKLSVKQNVALLNENFYHYYNSIPFKENTLQFDLNDLITHCIPNLDSGLPQINAFIETFIEERIDSNASACFNRLTNLNSVFEQRIDINLNFIQNLIKVFNLSDDINMQESILDLIYIFFHQRRKFFDCIAAFNEHLIDFSTIKHNPFNNKEKIKNHFRKFFYSYEKKKQEYEVKTLEDFFTFICNQCLHIIKKILKYWKNEFRILSLAYANKYYQNFKENELMIVKIEKMLKLLLSQKPRIDMTLYSKGVYLQFVEDFFDIIYFMRDNLENSLFNSLITILNEDGSLFRQMFQSLFIDFIDKGKQLSIWYSNKQFNFFRYVHDEMNQMKMYSTEQIVSMKNKYYSTIMMLITLQMITLPRNEKTLNLFQDMLTHQRTLFKYDSYCSFFIVMAISDLQKWALNLDFFSIMEKISELNQNTCEQNVIEPLGAFPNAFSHLYIEIMLNVLEFIIINNTMIKEINLDEIIVDNFIFLIKKISFNKQSKTKLKISYLKLVNYFHEIDSLNKIYLTKTRSEFSIISSHNTVNNSFLQPLELYPLFRKYFDGIIYDRSNIKQLNQKKKNSIKTRDLNDKQLTYIKSSFTLYKYLLFFYLEIDPKYFENAELMDNQREAYEWLRMIIKTGINGQRKTNVYNYNEDKGEVNDDETQRIAMQGNMIDYFESSFFYLIHCYTIMNIEKNKKYLIKYRDVFANEGIDLSIIEQHSYAKLDNYCRDSILNIHTGPNRVQSSRKNSNDDGDASNNPNDDDDDYDNEEKEKSLFYSTSSNDEVCLFIFKKLKQYDLNKENQLKYKHLLDNMKAKKKQTKTNKLNAFKAMLWKNSDELYQYATNESSSIIFYLLILLDSETTMQYDEIFITFINKIVEYISVGFSKPITHKRIKLTNFLLFIISEILRFYEDNEDELITYTIRKKTLREVQVMFLKTGIIEKCLSLVCRFNTPKIQPLLPNVFKMFCMMLRKGNYYSQETFLSLFTTKNKYEPVFSFMFDIITKQITEILSNKAKIIRRRKKQLSFDKKLVLKHQFETKLDSRILQFLQLLCENHNRKLQLYLHNQSNFRKCYDLVSQTQNYLTIILLNFESFLFEALVKCFDLLIEFIQGPCLENQLALINSKILVTLNDILLCYINCEKEVLNEKFPERIKDKEKIKKETRETDEPVYDTRLSKMSTQQVSLLSFKTSILLLALVENRTKDDSIYLTIKSVVKYDTIKEVYNKIFFEHLLILGDTNDLDDYVIKLNKFNRAQDVEEEAKTTMKVDDIGRKATHPNDYLILETGFFLYFLHLYYEDYEMNIERINKSVGKKTVLREIKEACSGTIYDIGESFSDFVVDFTLSILQTITYIISACVFAGSMGKVKIFNLMRRAFKHKVYSESHCIRFYNKYTQSIEILRDGIVYRIYFYLLPYCNLNKFEKIRFLEELDRTNIKTKLIEIIKFADQKKYEFEYDYKVKEYSTFIPLLGSLFKNVDLWKDLSLLLNLAQNFFNIFAVYKVSQTITMCITEVDCVEIVNWIDEKSFFRMTKEDFLNVILSLSYFQCSLAALIFVEFISRKMPAIYKSAKETVNQSNISQYKYQRYFRIWMLFLRGFIINFEVLYYFCYVFFAFLGTFTSDFFFSLLLFEIIQRFKTLRNVLKAIKNPYKQLFYTFTLWFILIYYFALFGYTFFRSNFPNSPDCSSLVRCVATIFYENNKRDNGIGGYLSSIYIIDKGTNPFVGRFWYDELFNLLLKILIIQMISGIIIDNFALLRVQEMDMLSDMENVCTICGLKKEEIQKVYSKYGRAYSDHLAVDHRLFNYVYYMLYLFQKDKTEFTGVESYIYELAYNQKDITWFPIENLYIAKPGEVAKEESNDDD